MLKTFYNEHNNIIISQHQDNGIYAAQINWPNGDISACTALTLPEIWAWIDEQKEVN